MRLITLFLFALISASSATEISIVTFNIRFATPSDGENQWANRKDSVNAFLAEQDYGIVCLQEALASQIDEITDGVSGYTTLGFGRDDGKRQGEHTAILFKASLYAVAASDTFWLSDTPDVVASKHWKNNVTRICTWARLIDRKTNRGFYVYNAHYDHQSEEARRKSTLLIAKHIAARKFQEPVLFCGDFNTGEDSWSMKYLRGEDVPAPTVAEAEAEASAETDAKPDKLAAPFTDTYREIHPDETIVVSFSGWRERTNGPKIDYVLIDNAFEVLDADILREKRDDRFLSDHHPVFAKVRLK